MARVPGVAEVVDHAQRHPVDVDQPLDRAGRLPGDVAGQRGVVLAARLPDQVVGEDLRRVVDAGGALEPGAAGRDLAAGERGVPSRHGVPLEQHDSRPALVGRQGGRATAGAGADDQHRHRDIEPGLAERQDPGRRHQGLIPCFFGGRAR
jgi:hypothetical protein